MKIQWLILMAFLVASSVISLHANAMSNIPKPSTGYTETMYPIVLVHGFTGNEDDFYKIPEALRKDGARVFIPTVSGMHTPEVRGEQLLSQVRDILAITGAEKVNFIAHSQGSPTARYVASVAPDIVASITSISGINKGTPVADTLFSLIESSKLVGGIIELFGKDTGKEPITIDSNGKKKLPQNLKAAIKSMNVAEAKRFNDRHPAGIPSTDCGEGRYQENGIYYYSMAGQAQVTTGIDPSDAQMAFVSAFFPAGERNDGLAGSCASHLGKVIRDDFNMNHLDEINKLLGLHSLSDTDPITMYRIHANRLKQQGL